MTTEGKAVLIIALVVIAVLVFALLIGRFIGNNEDRASRESERELLRIQRVRKTFDYKRGFTDGYDEKAWKPLSHSNEQETEAYSMGYREGVLQANLDKDWIDRNGSSNT